MVPDQTVAVLDEKPQKTKPKWMSAKARELRVSQSKYSIFDGGIRSNLSQNVRAASVLPCCGSCINYSRCVHNFLCVQSVLSIICKELLKQLPRKGFALFCQPIL